MLQSAPITSSIKRHWHSFLDATSHFVAPRRHDTPQAHSAASLRRSDIMESLDLDCDAVIVMIGQRLDRERDWILRQHAAVLQVPSLSDIQSTWINGQKISHLIVQIDYFCGIWEVFDELRRIRNTLPELPVVLVSYDFAQDDFRCERLALCDASLRAPVGLASLEFGLTEAANVNNPAWQTRLRDLQEAETRTII